MAKAKSAASSTKPAETVSNKSKMGSLELTVISDGITKLSTAVVKLKALADAMKTNGLSDITMQGPKSLKRGVNTVLGFAEQLSTAMEKLNRM